MSITESVMRKVKLKGGLLDFNDDTREFTVIVTSEVVDSQGEIVDWESIQAVLPKIKERGYAVNYAHFGVYVGHSVDIWESTFADVMNDYPETVSTLSKYKPDTRCLVGKNKIHKGAEIDDIAWEELKSGKINGVSFGGTFKELNKISCDGLTCGKVITTDRALFELALTGEGIGTNGIGIPSERPANPTSIILALKSMKPTSKKAKRRLTKMTIKAKDEEIPEGYHRMPDGTIMADSEHKSKNDNPCWDGYEQRGMKRGKGGKLVPNCVPKPKSKADEWWSKMTPSQQKDYIKKHPRSKYANQISGSEKDKEGKKDIKHPILDNRFGHVILDQWKENNNPLADPQHYIEYQKEVEQSRAERDANPTKWDKLLQEYGQHQDRQENSRLRAEIDEQIQTLDQKEESIRNKIKDIREDYLMPLSEAKKRSDFRKLRKEFNDTNKEETDKRRTLQEKMWEIRTEGGMPLSELKKIPEYQKLREERSKIRKARASLIKDYDKIGKSKTKADEWWNDMTPAQQQAYIRKHPRSKFANRMSGSEKDKEGKKDIKPSKERKFADKERTKQRLDKLEGIIDRYMTIDLPLEEAIKYEPFSTWWDESAKISNKMPEDITDEERKRSEELEKKMTEWRKARKWRIDFDEALKNPQFQDIFNEYLAVSDILRDWEEQKTKAKKKNDPKTPAKPSERRSGSKKNPKGSASGQRGDIKLSESQIKSIKTIIDKHNEKVKKKNLSDWKKVTLGQAKAVVRRGMGAFSTSHRPNVSSRTQWGLGRLNAFIYLLEKGKPKNAKYTTDNDLLPKEHKRSTKKAKADDTVTTSTPNFAFPTYGGSRLSPQDEKRRKDLEEEMAKLKSGFAELYLRDALNLKQSSNKSEVNLNTQSNNTIKVKMYSSTTQDGNPPSRDDYHQAKTMEMMVALMERLNSLEKRVDVQPKEEEQPVEEVVEVPQSIPEPSNEEDDVLDLLDSMGSEKTKAISEDLDTSKANDKENMKVHHDEKESEEITTKMLYQKMMELEEKMDSYGLTSKGSMIHSGDGDTEVNEDDLKSKGDYEDEEEEMAKAYSDEEEEEAMKGYQSYRKAEDEEEEEDVDLKAEHEDEDEEEVMKSKSGCGCNKFTTKSEVQKMIATELSNKGKSVETPITKVDGQLKTKSDEDKGVTLGDIVARASQERNFAPDMNTLIEYIKQ